LRLICLSQGGNPLPEIEWNLENKKKLQPVSTQSIIYTTESTLDFVLQRDYHNQLIECKSSNKVGSVSKSFRLNISCKFFKKIYLKCCYYYYFFNLKHRFTFRCNHISSRTSY
jgi:hypothetical protein